MITKVASFHYNVKWPKLFPVLGQLQGEDVSVQAMDGSDDNGFHSEKK